MAESDGGDQPTVDLRVQDPALLEEIHLYSELMIIAASSPEPMSVAAIDRALGVPNASPTG
jgi:hypothetical protein